MGNPATRGGGAWAPAVAQNTPAPMPGQEGLGRMQAQQDLGQMMGASPMMQAAASGSAAAPPSALPSGMPDFEAVKKMAADSLKDLGERSSAQKKADFFENLTQFGLALMAAGDVQPGATQGPSFAGAVGKAGLATAGSIREQRRYTETQALAAQDRAEKRAVEQATAARDIYFKGRDLDLKAENIKSTNDLKIATLAIQEGQNKIANSIHWAQVQATREGKAFDHVKYMNDIEDTFQKQTKQLDTLDKSMPPMGVNMTPEQWAANIDQQRLDAATRADQNRVSAGQPPIYVEQVQRSQKKQEPTERSIKMLRENPNKAADFDALFGPGAAAKILGTR